jgi:alpha-maltose-1-phosphate synthase
LKIAIYYHPEAFNKLENINGRHVAGNSFLRALLLYANNIEIYILVKDNIFIQYFIDFANLYGLTNKVNFLFLNDLGTLNQVDLLFFPGPSLNDLAFHRNITSLNNKLGWSLCGITHTTSSSTAMDDITGLITSPIEISDAIICTSSSVKSNVLTVLNSQINYLKDRFGIDQFTTPLLPVIPLGVHFKEFNFNYEFMIKSRSLLGIPEDAIVVLYLGRLSFHSKANPFAMYQSIQNASIKTNKNIVLLECGWYFNEAIKQSFDDLAKSVCPQIRRVFIDGRVTSNCLAAWACADIFCSLSDNIQESFGISPIEAMSAGLPCLVSDWNGYKDTVRDGIDGFRVKSFMPQAGLGLDLSLSHALGIDSYDMYCAKTSIHVSIDIDDATNKLSLLVSSKELRLEMGTNARKRAETEYDWKNIIPKYQSLWSEQIAIKRCYKLKSQFEWPSRLDPFYSFAEYPTHNLNEDFLISSVHKDEVGYLEFLKLKDLKVLSAVNFFIKDLADIKRLFVLIDQKPSSFKEIKHHFDATIHGKLLRCVVSLHKIGLIRIHI